MVKNQSHTLAYSLIGLQEMNLAYRFPIMFWNCACLIADSGGTESEDSDENSNENGLSCIDYDCGDYSYNIEDFVTSEEDEEDDDDDDEDEEASTTIKRRRKLRRRIMVKSQLLSEKLNQVVSSSPHQILTSLRLLFLPILKTTLSVMV